MCANIAGIYGAQIYRSDDKPLYRRAFGSAIGVLSAALFLAILRYADAMRLKRRAQKSTKS